MILENRKKKSLTFYQPTSIQQNTHLSSSYAGGIGATAISTTVYVTSTTTTQFNNQLNEFLNTLHVQRDRISQKVSEGLANDLSYKGARNDGVKLAWSYEKADVEMGGKGSANWDKEQQQEIRENGRVRGSEGHHQKNVADHPEEQGNPNNIKFYKSKEEHKDQGHDGNWKNESDAPMIDKDKMLKKTNLKRVLKNEFRGIGIAAAIGVGIGFTIGFAVSIAQSGITPESIKYAISEGGKAGVVSGIQSIVGYGIGRTIGNLAVHAVEGLLSNIGVIITENISKMCNMGIVGGITIGIFSTYQFIKLKKAGIATREAAIQIGKQALFSLSLLAVSIAAQGIWGGPMGLIVSVSTGIIFITYSIIDITHQRKMSEKIRVYMIDKCKPSFV